MVKLDNNVLNSQTKHTASAIAWIFAYAIDTSWSTGRTIAVAIALSTAFNKWISVIVLNQFEMIKMMWLPMLLQLILIRIHFIKLFISF